VNKRKVREVTKYLVWWKGFTAENDNWKKEKNLKNVKEEIVEFKGRMNTEVRQQEKLDIAEVGHSRRKRLKEGGITRKIHSKDVVQMG